MNIDYEECLKFIEGQGVKLYNFQKDMVKCMCEGTSFVSCRGAGRNMIADLVGQFIAKKLSENDYTVAPDVIINADRLVLDHYWSQEWLDKTKERMNSEQFKKEYMGEWVFKDEM